MFLISVPSQSAANRGASKCKLSRNGLGVDRELLSSFQSASLPDDATPRLGEQQDSNQSWTLSETGLLQLLHPQIQDLPDDSAVSTIFRMTIWS